MNMMGGRSDVMDIQSSDDPSLRELALFAGAGGGILGGKLLGWQTVCAVERDAYAASILAQRQNDGCLEPFPIWSDVETFDGRPWAGVVDIISCGFPCQDVSCGNPDGQGIDGERSGLWREAARIVHEVRPRYVLVENSPVLTSRGLGRVLGDLAALGFNARWGMFSCRDVGGWHRRERIWILASNHREERIQRLVRKPVSPQRRFPWGKDGRGREDIKNRSDLPEPVLLRRQHDVAHYVDRISAIGNGQVPPVMALAWDTLSSQT